MMKKFLLLFVFAAFLTSCDISDDGPTNVLVPAVVTNLEVPEYVENGEKYTIAGTYLLPDACHVPAGVDVRRLAEFGDGYREIQVMGVASVEFGVECTKESEDLEEEFEFEITIDKDEPYTFYVYKGVDEDGKDIWDEIEVPVGAPEEEVAE